MKKTMPIFLNFVIVVLSIITHDIYTWKLLMLSQIILNSVYLFQHSSNKISVGLFFFLLLCLFHYGQYAINDPSLIFTVPSEILDKGTRFAIATISMIQIGYFNTLPKNVNCGNLSVALEKKSLRRFLKFLRVFLFLTILPMLAVDVYKLLYGFAYGYEEFYQVMSTIQWIKFANIIAPFARPLLLLLLVCNSYDKQKSKMILLFSLLYFFILMFSGARAISVIYILSFLLIYCKLFVHRISAKMFVFAVLAIIIFVEFLPLVAQLRHVTNYDLMAVQEVSDRINEDRGKIGYFCNEFGSTMISLLYMIDWNEKFNLGLTYITSVFRISFILPNSLAELSQGFTSALPSKYQGFLGGSCIGELWYNFGWFGIVFAYFIGKFVSYIERGLCEFSHKNFFTFIISISIFPFMLLWVRGYFHEMVYVGFWIPTITYLFHIGSRKQKQL